MCAFSRKTTTEEGVIGTGMIEQRMFLPDDVEHMYWQVEGTPRNRTRVERLDSAHATAGNLFNRIPDIIAARPGIVPVYEMGPLRSTAKRWPKIVCMSTCPLGLSVEQLMAKSREIAGVDIVDEDIVEPLTVLHRALNEEAQLDAEGCRAYEAKFLRLLANRLRMKRDFLRHPEIAEQPVEGTARDHGRGEIGHDQAAEGSGRVGRLQLPHVLAELQLGLLQRRARRADRGANRRGR